MANPQKTFRIGNTIYRLMTVVNMGTKETVAVPMGKAKSETAVTTPVEVQGPPGANGKDGVNGTDGSPGKSVELQLDNGALQWRQSGGNWQNLYMMSQMRGPRGLAGTNGVDGLHGSDGKDGSNGKDGTDGLDGQPGKDGIDGLNGKDGFNGTNGIDGKQGIQGIQGKDGPKGADGSNGTNGTNGKDGTAGTNGKDGAAGKDGTNDLNGTGLSLIGSVTIGQNATVAVALGIREITTALTGAVAGKRYLCFVRSYKLNGGASVAGRPSGYSILDCVSNAAGQITVSLNAPLLAVGSSYALTCEIMEAV